MGHLFVPAALVLWVGMAVVRAVATPAPTPVQAVEVQRETPRQAESSDKSVSEARRSQAQVHSEG